MDYRTEYIKSYQDKTRIYFIENYLTTFNAMENKDTPFLLFPRQKVYLDAIVKYNNVISKKHRQCGITTVSAGWSCGQCVFAKKESPEIILCIANKLDQAEELTRKIITFLEQVPRWMWGPDFYSPNKDDPKNKRSIFVKKNKGYTELFNGCKIYARASSPHAARGISAVTILIMDEAAFIEEGTAAFASAVAAQSSVMDSKCLIVSTPNGKDQLYYGIYAKALKKENNFHIVEFKWFQDLRYNRNLKWYKKSKKTGELEWNIDTVIDKKGNIKYDEERWNKLEQNGWTPTSPWFEKMCKSFNNDQQKIAQEILVSFLGSSNNMVPVEVIERQQKENVRKITEDWPLKDIHVSDTWIWEDPDPTHRYIIAVDPASGSGPDRTSIEVIDVDAIDENGQPYYNQVLEYNGKINGSEVGNLVDKYGRIYNDALAVVECIGGYGDIVVMKLMDLEYPNLYYDEREAMKNYTIGSLNRLKKGVDAKLPGFRSNDVRLQMANNFVQLLRSNAFRVRSERVISELDTWINKNGRPDHMTGMHDDTITCLYMGLFVMQFYMFRTEKEKKKDHAILKSWYINTSSFSTETPQTRVGTPTDNTPKKQLEKQFDPFNPYSTNKRKNMVNACIMLGGFNLKK